MDQEHTPVPSPPPDDDTERLDDPSTGRPHDGSPHDGTDNPHDVTQQSAQMEAAVQPATPPVNPSEATSVKNDQDGSSVPRTVTLFVAAIAGGLVGVVLAVFALMDWTRFANYAFIICLLLAHVCAGVLLGYAIKVFGPGRKELRKKQTKKYRRALKWGFLTLVVGVALWYLDGFVFGLSERSGTRVALLILSGLAVIAGAVWVLVAERHDGDDQKSVSKPSRILLAATATLPIGALLVLVAFDRISDQRQQSADDAIAELTELEIDLPAEFPNYVALGDSYSAGEGVEPFLNSPAAYCHRSAYGYPRLLTFADEARVDFRACAGAVTADVDLGSPGGYGPQIDASERHDVGLVTMTLGGNDVVFSAVVRQCILFEDCVNQRFEPPDAPVERPTVRYPDTDLDDYNTFKKWARAALSDEYLGGNIDRVYTKVADTYPNARIVIVGYPYLFPDQPAEWTFSDCAAILRRVDHDERVGLRTLMDELNGMLAAKAYAHNLEFISPVAAWAGHEPCGTENDQWVNAVRLDLSNLHDLAIVNGSTFHPNRLGQAELGRLISCYLIEHPMPISAEPAVIPGDDGYPLHDDAGACVLPPVGSADD